VENQAIKKKENAKVRRTRKRREVGAEAGKEVGLIRQIAEATVLVQALQKVEVQVAGAILLPTLPCLLQEVTAVTALPTLLIPAEAADDIVVEAVIVVVRAVEVGVIVVNRLFEAGLHPRVAEVGVTVDSAVHGQVTIAIGARVEAEVEAAVEAEVMTNVKEPDHPDMIIAEALVEGGLGQVL